MKRLRIATIRAAFLSVAALLGTTAQSPVPFQKIVSVRGAESMSDGTTWAVALKANVMFETGLTLHLHSRTTDYAIALADVSFDRVIPGRTEWENASYGAAPIFVALPPHTELVAAYPQTPTQTVSTSCTSLSDEDKRSLPELRNAFAGSPAAVTSGIVSTPDPMDCNEPFRDVSMLSAAMPKFPEQAREAGETGSAWVKVILTETGAVESVSVYRSSGSKSLDAATMEAARTSTYRPEVRACKAVPGSYLFRADFTGQ